MHRGALATFPVGLSVSRCVVLNGVWGAAGRAGSVAEVDPPPSPAALGLDPPSLTLSVYLWTSTQAWQILLESCLISVFPPLDITAFCNIPVVTLGFGENAGLTYVQLISALCDSHTGSFFPADKMQIPSVIDSEYSIGNLTWVYRAMSVLLTPTCLCLTEMLFLGLPFASSTFRINTSHRLAYENTLWPVGIALFSWSKVQVHCQVCSWLLYFTVA